MAMPRLGRFGAAGPGPVLGRGNQAGRNGIRFDVQADFAEFLGRTDPTIEGFILPEMLVLAAEDAVGFVGCRALDAVGDARYGNLWRN